jgi:hypothetical protein
MKNSMEVGRRGARNREGAGVGWRGGSNTVYTYEYMYK